MKAKFTRGHRPDRKRGERYRRVLLQEGKLILDSDVAATVDATDGLLRELAHDLGCAAGSPDRGFLITPGPLLALFDDLGAVGSVSAAPFRAFRDYGRKYLDRYPSLRLDATQAAGSVRIAFPRDVRSQTVHLWARIPVGVTVTLTVEGETPVPVPGTNANAFELYEVAVPGTADEFDGLGKAAIVALAAGAQNEISIGLVEMRRDAQKQPRLWVAAGKYYLDGLEVQTADSRFPEISFPQAAGFVEATYDQAPADGAHVVAYLEAWERLITAVEDEGLLERALGGHDTCVRTRAVGQVKLAVCPSDPRQVMDAFKDVERGTGELTVDLAQTTTSDDPCQVPKAGGYTGAENRLYRFEVHEPGNVGTAVIKWSRNNGADLFGLAAITPVGAATQIRLDNSNLRDGDLVELLGERIDLGDDVHAAITAGKFVPSRRSVGTLYFVRAEPEDPSLFRLLNSAKQDVSVALAELGPVDKTKVRRWDGLVTTAATVDLPDGLKLTMTGSFRTGDYWQFEARTLKDNSGPWVAKPHGPERLFAPLALLKFENATSPLKLECWLDERFPALCDVDADDVSYDGNQAGTPADTVQEALDELFARREGGCCQATLDEGLAGDDDGARIQQALNQSLPQGGVLCLRAGTYRIKTKVSIVGKSYEIRGCPSALLIDEVAGEPAFEIGAEGRLALSEITLLAQADTGGAPLVDLPVDTARFSARSCGFVHVGAIAPAPAIRAGGSPATLLAATTVFLPENPKTTFPTIAGTRTVELDGCVLLARWGVLAADLQRLALDHCVVLAVNAAVAANDVGQLCIADSVLDTRLSDATVAALAATQLPAIEAAIEAALGAALPDPAFGTALYAREALDGFVRGCEIVGETGVRLGRARHIRLSGNRTTAAAYGVRFDNAIGASVLGDQISTTLVDSVAMLLPVTGFDLAVSDCVLAATVGVMLGIPIPGMPAVPFRQFVNVRISENRITSGIYGVQLGSVGVATQAGVCQRVEIAANTIESKSGVGVYVLPPIPPANELSPSVGVIDNQIRAFHTGVIVRGTGTEVRGNRLEALDDSPSVGVFLDEAIGASVQNNRMGATILQGTTPKFVGLRIFRGSGAVVAENIVRGAMLAITVTLHPDLILSRNELAGGVVLVQVNGLVLRDNVAEQTIQVTNSDDVTVVDNVVGGPRGDGGSQADLLAVGLGGRCQVSGNRVGGTLRIQPGTTSVTALEVPVLEAKETGVNFDPHVVKDLRYDVEFAQVHNVPPRNEIDGPGHPNVPPGGVDPVSPGGGDPVPRFAGVHPLLLTGVGAAGGTTVPYVPASYTGTPENAGAWSRAATLVVGKAFAAGVLAGVEAAGVFLTFVEENFQAQVEGNWAQDIEVGFGPSDKRAPDKDTAVQVVANRANAHLTVNDYTHVVLAHNQSARLIGPAPAGNAVINEKNGTLL